MFEFTARDVGSLLFVIAGGAFMRLAGLFTKNTYVRIAAGVAQVVFGIAVLGILPFIAMVAVISGAVVAISTAVCNWNLKAALIGLKLELSNYF